MIYKYTVGPVVEEQSSSTLLFIYPVFTLQVAFLASQYLVLVNRCNLQYCSYQVSVFSSV